MRTKESRPIQGFIIDPFEHCWSLVIFISVHEIPEYLEQLDSKNNPSNMFGEAFCFTNQVTKATSRDSICVLDLRCENFMEIAITDDPLFVCSNQSPFSLHFHNLTVQITRRRIHLLQCRDVFLVSIRVKQDRVFAVWILDPTDEISKKFITGFLTSPSDLHT